MNKMHVFKTETGWWRFTNLSTIGGNCETWDEAFAEAFSLATVSEVCS